MNFDLNLSSRNPEQIMTKKTFAIVTRTLTLFSLGLASGIHAGSVDNRNNNSAEYIRSLSRNAATDGADASIYNPAGTVMLTDGFHLAVDNQTVAKFNRQEIVSQNTAYESNIVSPIYPTAFAVFKKADWTAFTAFSFPGGGGELDYEKGSVTAHILESNLRQFSPSENADAYLRSLYYGITLGGAYALNPQISLSLAVRAIYARTDVTVDADAPKAPLHTTKLIDHMEEARGATVVAGADFNPGHGLTVGVRLEGPTPLEWEVQKSTLNLDEVLKDPGVRALFVNNLRNVLRAPGEKFQRDLPANVGLGLGYAFCANWSSSLSFNYYLNTLADWGGKENDHNDGWEISLSAEHQWPIPLLTSVGAQYTVSGAKSSSYNIENPALNSYSLGAGGRYGLGKHVSLNLGFTGNFAIDDKAQDLLVKEVDLKKHVLVYALGLEYNFL